MPFSPFAIQRPDRTEQEYDCTQEKAFVILYSEHAKHKKIWKEAGQPRENEDFYLRTDGISEQFPLLLEDPKSLSQSDRFLLVGEYALLLFILILVKSFLLSIVIRIIF